MKLYFKRGLSNKDILHLLAHKHHSIIRTRTKRNCLFPRKDYMDLKEITSFWGMKWPLPDNWKVIDGFFSGTIQRGFTVSKEIIRQVIKILDPEGLELQHAWLLQCWQYTSRGPNALLYINTDEKVRLYRFAINGCMDGFSHHKIWMEASDFHLKVQKSCLNRMPIFEWTFSKPS